MMERITERYNTAETTKQAAMEAWYEGKCNRDRFMVEGKKDLEAWILSRFVDAYNTAAESQLIWVDSREAPDFALYDERSQLIGYVEVTEWLDPYPDRKRDEEYRGIPTVAARLIDDDPKRDERVIEHLRNQVKKKFTKSYPENTWLLIYINVTSSLFWQTDTSDVFKRETDIVAKVIADLSTYRPSSISEVWVLNPTRSTESVVHRVFPDRWRCSGNWLSTNLSNSRRDCENRTDSPKANSLQILSGSTSATLEDLTETYCWEL
jgi:hypothetical protein